jgi:hypothetical protein
MWKYVVTYIIQLCLLRETKDGLKYLDCTNDTPAKQIFSNRDSMNVFFDSVIAINEKLPRDSSIYYYGFKIDSIKKQPSKH